MNRSSARERTVPRRRMTPVGRSMGPPAMGTAIDRWGGWALFAVGLAAVVAVLIVWGAIRARSPVAAVPASEMDESRGRRVA